jgi:Ca2+-binding EF-hand superfamily protein
MGCTVSFHYSVERTVVGRNQDCTDLLYTLSLQKLDLDILFTAFTDIDADDSGTIRFDELFAYFRIEPTKFNETVFGYCDVDRRGYLTFLDFVIGIWLFLTVDQSELGGYAFILFDMDCTGILDCEEIINLIHIIHNKTTIQSVATLQVLESLKLSKESFTCEKFQYWTRTHLSLLEPAQTLQLNLRKNLIGDNYWQQKTVFRKAQPQFSNLNYIYNLKQRVYEIQKKQVIELIEERILIRRQYDFNGRKGQVPRGQRTTALLEYFNLAKGKPGERIRVKDKLGLSHQRKAEQAQVHKPVKRKDLERRYRVDDENEDLEPSGQAHPQPSPISGHGQFLSVDRIPEGHESKEQESQKAPVIVAASSKGDGYGDECGDGDGLDINALLSSLTKGPSPRNVAGRSLSPATSTAADVNLGDVLIFPEKQRRRRSSFLMKKPRLLLKSEIAQEEIKRKNKKKMQKSGGKVVPTNGMMGGN